MTAGPDTLKTTKQNRIVRVNPKLKKLIIKKCARGIILLKLTTDRHEASRGLFATAELLVIVAARC